MAYMNKEGYLERKTNAGRRNSHGKSTKRMWWLIKAQSKGKSGQVPINRISFPERYLGKKVRFKVEFIEEKR